ncbi:MAG: hypothetical protein F3739_02150 [Nitrospinae bacterium]|nr:hypothetical protein [Nitrospinota bacterium]
MSLSKNIPIKLAKVLMDVFGEHPLMHFEDKYLLFNFTFVAGSRGQTVEDFTYFFKEIKDKSADFISSPTDDWPYLYLDRPGIPSHYLKAGGILLLISLISVYAATGRKSIKKLTVPYFCSVPVFYYWRLKVLLICFYCLDQPGRSMF